MAKKKIEELRRQGGGKEPKPSKGFEKARGRAEKANAEGDRVQAKAEGKSPGRFSRRDMRNMRGRG